MSSLIHLFGMAPEEKKEKNILNKNHKMIERPIEFSQEERIYL